MNSFISRIRNNAAVTIFSPWRIPVSSGLLSLLLSLACCLFAPGAAATIVFLGSATGSNNALPINGTAGSLTISRPAAAEPGRVMIVSIAARPSQMTWTVPAGWTELSVAAEQTGGGVSTAPGGMTMRTYYRVTGLTEPANYTWMLANPVINQGGSAVAGMLVFSGVDTASNPLDGTPTSRLNPSSTTHRTNAVTTLTANSTVVSMISFLSSDTFANPTCNPAVTPAPTIVEALDVAAPPPVNAIGTTLQMAYFTQVTPGVTCATQAVAGGGADTGIGHLLALRPSTVDLRMLMTRNPATLVAGGTVAYSLDVRNIGTVDPGPVSVINTLPAGMTYTGFSGTGWACGAIGQTVTCSRAGSLAANTSAALLVLNASISASPPGTLTNSATVSGTGGDADVSNNTASDSFSFPIPAYAYYAMHETTWTGTAGEVQDSSGNTRNASIAGLTTPFTLTAAAAAGLKPDTCRGFTVPTNTSSATVQGVDSGIDINALGTSGSIAFWYKSNRAWNVNSSDNDDRTLLDATVPGSSNDRFWLALNREGSLTFRLRDSGGTDRSTTTPVFTTTANTWRHIAIVWNYPGAGAYVRIYVDGVLQGETTGNFSPRSYGNLLIGDTRSTTTNGSNRGNSADGMIDEAGLYAVPLNAAQIIGLMNTASPCPVVSPNHLRIEHTGSGVTCTPGSITVKACADAACSTLFTGGVTGTLTATGTPTTNWGGGGSFTIPGSGSVVKSVQVTTPGSVVFGTSGELPVPASATQCYVGATAACSFTAADAGFIFDVPNHVSDVLQTVNVSAVKQSDSSLVCVPAFASTSKTVSFACAYSNPVSGTLPVAVDGTNVACGTPNNVSLAFNASGVASTTFRYADVGSIALTATYTGSSGTEAGLVMTGSDPFIAAPASFVVVPTGTLIAGSGFSATVTAKNASGNTTPNFGKETTPETAELKPVTAAAASATNSQLVGPVAGATGTLTAGAFTLAKCSPASAGSVCDTALIWTEVGDLMLSAALKSGSYLGSGMSAWGSAAANGFRPAYFDTAVTPGIGTFTYSRQPYTVTVTAKNALGGTTTNYAGSYAQLVTLSDANAGTNSSGTLGSFANASIPAASFTLAAAGVASTTTIAYGFNTPATAPLTLAMRAVDAGGVSSSGHAEGTNLIRSGRLHLSNAVGAEQLPLTVPAVVQFYDGSNWLTSTTDSSSPTPWAIAPAGSTPLVGVGNTTATLGAALASGIASLSASAPGANAYGYLDLTVNPPDYLKFPWSGCTVPTACVPAEYLSPAARVTFGIFKGNNRIIYRRERY